MARWYRVRSWSDEPEPVNVVGETEKMVLVEGLSGHINKLLKHSDSYRHFPTWAEARQHLRERALDRLNDAEARVNLALQRQVKVNQIPEEEPA